MHSSNGSFTFALITNEQNINMNFQSIQLNAQQQSLKTWKWHLLFTCENALTPLSVRPQR